MCAILAGYHKKQVWSHKIWKGIDIWPIGGAGCIGIAGLLMESLMLLVCFGKLLTFGFPFRLSIVKNAVPEGLQVQGLIVTTP